MFSRSTVHPLVGTVESVGPSAEASTAPGTAASASVGSSDGNQSRVNSTHASGGSRNCSNSNGATTRLVLRVTTRKARRVSTEPGQSFLSSSSSSTNRSPASPATATTRGGDSRREVCGVSVVGQVCLSGAFNDPADFAFALPFQPSAPVPPAAALPAASTPLHSIGDSSSCTALSSCDENHEHCAASATSSAATASTVADSAAPLLEIATAPSSSSKTRAKSGAAAEAASEHCDLQWVLAAAPLR